jgi:hypothetical protein
MKQVCRLDCTFFRRLNEPNDLALLQAEALCQRALDHAFLTILDAIVAAARDFDQQHGKRES